MDDSKAFLKQLVKEKLTQPLIFHVCCGVNDKFHYIKDEENTNTNNENVQNGSIVPPKCLYQRQRDGAGVEDGSSPEMGDESTKYLLPSPPESSAEHRVDDQNIRTMMHVTPSRRWTHEGQE